MEKTIKKRTSNELHLALLPKQQGFFQVSQRAAPDPAYSLTQREVPFLSEYRAILRKKFRILRKKFEILRKKTDLGHIVNWVVGSSHEKT